MDGVTENEPLDINPVIIPLGESSSDSEEDDEEEEEENQDVNVNEPGVIQEQIEQAEIGGGDPALAQVEALDDSKAMEIESDGERAVAEEFKCKYCTKTFGVKIKELR